MRYRNQISAQHCSQIPLANTKKYNSEKKEKKTRIKIYYASFNVYHPWVRAISILNGWRENPWGKNKQKQL